MNITDNLRILATYLIALSTFCALAIPCQAQEGAKNLFYRQQSNPGSVLNNGIQYWFELNRSGKVLQVSNKFAFKSGDKIRIHIKANIDAFAYVLLKDGSKGEQSVLFPDEHFHDNNKIKASVEYSIPQDGYLAFDRTPGTENLILLLSRQTLDANKYLADKTKKHVTIAAVPSGAKDLIPGSVVMAFSKEDSALPASLPDRTSRPSQIAVQAPETTPSITTLVQTDPNQVLAVELALLHEP